MTRAPWVFWNASERRLRAGWRILIQVAAFLTLVVAWDASAPGPRDLLPDFVAERVPHALMLVTSLIAIRLLDRTSLRSAGLAATRATWSDLRGGMVCGAAAAGACVAIGVLSGALRLSVPAFIVEHESRAIDVGFAAAALVAVSEEAWFRAYLQRNVADGLRGLLGERGAVFTAIAVISAVFAALHLPAGDTPALAVVNLGLGGAALGWMYAGTRRLAAPVGFHFAWNAVLGPICGAPVSGRAPQGSFGKIEVLGSDLWTGGSYGPEGGMLATLVLCVLIAYVLYRWPSRALAAAGGCTRAGDVGAPDGSAPSTPRPNDAGMEATSER
ncbi:MAG: CPBP family intramembrane metalloprotease [Planctomycetota bacterium]|nr:MAG: CPBP family intramembrane metalloprotease [Planctomycetota bacterium]